MPHELMTAGTLTPSEAENQKLLRQLQQRFPGIIALQESISLCIIYTGDQEQMEALMEEILAARNPDGKLEPVINTAPLSGGKVGTGKTEGSL